MNKWNKYNNNFLKSLFKCTIELEFYGEGIVFKKGGISRMALPNYWEEDVLHCNVLQTSIKEKRNKNKNGFLLSFVFSLFLI